MGASTVMRNAIFLSSHIRQNIPAASEDFQMLLKMSKECSSDL